jgi:hypothetical protein
MFLDNAPSNQIPKVGQPKETLAQRIEKIRLEGKELVQKSFPTFTHVATTINTQIQNKLEGGNKKRAFESVLSEVKKEAPSFYASYLESLNETSAVANFYVDRTTSFEEQYRLSEVKTKLNYLYQAEQQEKTKPKTETFEQKLSEFEKNLLIKATELKIVNQDLNKEVTSLEASLKKDVPNFTSLITQFLNPNSSNVAKLEKLYNSKLHISTQSEGKMTENTKSKKHKFLSKEFARNLKPENYQFLNNYNFENLHKFFGDIFNQFSPAKFPQSIYKFEYFLDELALFLEKKGLNPELIQKFLEIKKLLRARNQLAVSLKLEIQNFYRVNIAKNPVSKEDSEQKKLQQQINSWIKDMV